jgi:hypothetical protein
MFLNAVPDFYTPRSASNLQAFIDNPPTGYLNNMDSYEPHGSLTGGCGLISPTREYCAYNENSLVFTKDVVDTNAKECQEYIAWAKERGAEYLNYGDNFIRFEGSQNFAQRLCVTSISLSFSGKLNQNSWQTDFSMGMINVSEVGSSRDENNTVDIAQLPNAIGDYYVQMNTALNKVGSYRLQHNIEGGLTKKQVSQALGTSSKDWLSLPGSDGKILYLEGQSKETNDSKLCLVIAPYNPELIGLPDTGKDYWPILWTSGTSFGEYLTDRCPVD